MEDNILFYTEGEVEMPKFFDKQIIFNWFEKIAEHYECEMGELNFIFCDDENILRINREYLQHDYYTDVITFDYRVGDILNGDIYISLDTVLSNSQEFSTEYREEFHRVVCHSLLHIIGFKDKTEVDALAMRDNENICLNLLKESLT